MPRFTVPDMNVALLSSPGKTPCKSFSLPAVRSCPSAFFGKGAICGESKTDLNCYASKRAYTWPVVVNALNARYQWAIRASMDKETGDEFVSLMTLAIEQEAKRQIRKGQLPVFRVHDSGDLFSPSYAYLWLRVCQKLPRVGFWLPTRQWRTQNPHMRDALVALAALPNVTVRPSALRFEDSAPIVLGLSAGTTASVEGYNCPASLQDNKCGDCRQCWDGKIEVVYKRH